MERHFHKNHQKIVYQRHDRPTLADSQDGRPSIIYIHIRLLTQVGITDEDKLLPKIFGTHLRYCGIESEIVNLLESRISPEIFVRHYWSPNMKQDIERVRKAIDKLADQLM